MKIGKIGILLIIIASLLSINGTAVAIQENELITDPAGDVYYVDAFGFDEGGEEFTYITEHDDIEVKNIDVRELRYQRINKTVTMTLKVEGKIEDRGNLDDFNMDEPSFDLDLITNVVVYSFELMTSHEKYAINYANNTCVLIYFSTGEQINLTESDFSINNNILTVSFNLLTEDETFEEMSAMGSFMKVDWSFIFNWDGSEEIDNFDELFVYLLDMIPNPPLSVNADVQLVGEVNVPILFEGITMFGQPPYTYEWDFGDDVTSTEKNPTHTYTLAGVYQYTFTATDNSGYSDSVTYEIEILGEDTQDTPGFGVLIAFIAIGFLFWFKKKQ